jgi:PAS domain S-box-containing protein
MTSVINSTPDLIFYKDLEGVYLGANKAFSEPIGRPIDEIVGKTDFDLFPENYEA